MPTTIDQIQLSNSTTYVDLLGLQLGLTRLPGENANAYLKRLEAAARLVREHPYEGALNETNLQLGFEPQVYATIHATATDVITVSIAGVTIGSHPTVPILTFDSDTMWNWRLLSAVVADLNQYAHTELKVKDGPAFQLARQSNSLWSFAENVSGLQMQLRHSGIRIGSELFNQTVPSYTLDTSGTLTFDMEPDVGTQITYNYITAPYDLVGSPVAMIGLKDAEFSSIANAPNGALAYQIREFVQAIMLIDRSYWAK
jgi:hypothetical protein